MATKYLRGSIKDNIAKVKELFTIGVRSVQPQELIKRHIQKTPTKLTVDKVTYELNRNVYVVGFGKAAIGMVRPLEEALRDEEGNSHIRGGVVSVPVGIQETFASRPDVLPDQNSCIEIMEGAKDNIPDEAAFMASKKILDLVKSLRKEDLLIVLITGGGSALLPYPVAGLSIEEKSGLVKALGQKGATITELNTVRKALSLTKGGRLATATQATIVSLILSDIIGNPLDMIASGPTVANKDPPGAAMEILQKYNIALPQHLDDILKKNYCESQIFPDVNNCIIGSNETALRMVHCSVPEVMEKDCKSMILSSSLCGEAKHVGKNLAVLARNLLNALSTGHTADLDRGVLRDLCDSEVIISDLENIVQSSKVGSCPLVLLFGGETTVLVEGSGKGGRNQEMVLAFSLEMEKKKESVVGRGEVVLLSGGSDGIDGPTDAAGAVTYTVLTPTPAKSQIQEAVAEGLSPASFLKENDSYTYFSRLGSGKYLLQPGHTGTNVMDLQILLIYPYY